jgi:hypothetical protein
VMVRVFGEDPDPLPEAERSGECGEAELADKAAIGDAPRRIETRSEAIELVR